MNILKSVFYQYKGGKGVTGPPPEKGIKRYFFLTYTHFWRLIGLNMLFILFCLPVITIPPSISAMNKVLITLAREGNVFFVRDFIDEFKSDFIKSWLAFIPWLIVIAAAVYGYWHIGDVYRNALGVVLFVTICLILYCYSNYCYAMIALIDLPLNKIMKNAAIFVLSEFRRNVFLILTIPVFILSVMYFLFLLPLIIFFNFSFLGLINMMIVNEALKEQRVIKQNFESEAS